ncbi:uncharacterized protein LOC116426036 isoform X2 [Nomia melanderi]|uniref:uncharacterized protein LOC116426036 isoform X2 n=1 Tax=Nomia melanderi TaxID=2448451 RepID=UPI00130469F5|nr:formin-binding protein 4-like isoform X2 [Nomia melanderi]
MKRRQRRPVLELNQTQAGSHGDHVQNKRKQTNLEYPGQNVPGNPLANLLCHYNSDSDTEDPKKDVCKLDDQVNNFLKEIQLIAPKQPIANEFNNAALTTNSNTQLSHHTNQQASMWRECLDESSGYPYYWHIETNEVTWEMPEELRYMKNNVKTSSVMKPHSMQDSHWVDFSSVAYQSHENIPEGMIPREVVARNRNRYIRNETAKKQEPPTDQDTTNTSDTMDNESDDGKIEMITSYGSEESDSDSADENHSKSEAPPTSTSESVSTNSTTKPKDIFSSSTSTRHPQMLKASQNLDQDTEEPVENSRTEVLDSKLVEEKDAKYSKNQVQEPQECIERVATDSRTVRDCKTAVANDGSSKSNPGSDFDFRVSLVPGYDEDSDPEEEPEVRQERKALFPIPQTENTMEGSSLKVHRVPDNGDSSVVNSEKRNVQELENEVTSEKTESGEEVSSKPEDDGQKANKFLDNLHGRSKFFQRKKRIAFEVPSTKKKPVDKDETVKPEIDAQQEETNTSDSVDRTDEVHADPQEEQTTVITEDKPEDVADHITEPSKLEEEATTPSETTGDSKEDEGEVALLSQIILEKLKFLSEGKPTVSPVQMMSIQLQTLFVAWEGGCLEKSYLRRWLTDTSHELERLEQDAAPPGWLCQWDRSHKRYYYQNTATGVTQWIYPDTGIAGGAEEMEICSTPPPMEQEEMIATAEEEGLKSKPKKPQEGSDTSQDVTISRNPDVEAPPPPQISNPSPPPPPRIYGNDMKKDKRKRDKGSDALDSKKQRVGEEGTVITEVSQLENPAISSLSNPATSLSPQATTLANIANVANVTSVTNVEPLPPGVDLTEAPYELPATALKRIIYSAVQPQGTALYDATARDPAVPILSHPAAIVQEHYLQYPAYQHLHSPAALVLPHKHGVQPAIQIIPDYTPIYTNHKVIEKPPIKTAKESLVSALDSFYNDIARIENSRTEKVPQRQDIVTTESSLPVEEAKVDMELETLHVDAAMKEKKKKKARIGISKKHKEVSSMVAKWQKVQQNFENT